MRWLDILLKLSLFQIIFSAIWINLRFRLFLFFLVVETQSSNVNVWMVSACGADWLPAQVPSLASRFTGRLTYWVEERTDSCVCGARRSGSVWNPSKLTSKRTERRHRHTERVISLCLVASSVLLCAVMSFRGHVTSLSIHPSGKLALSVGTDKTLR